MIHDLKPYPAYKDSGVPWLGEVPEHWEVKRTDHVMLVRKSLIQPQELRDKLVCHFSIPNVQKFGTGASESGDSIDSAKIRLFESTLLVSRLNPRMGTITFAKPDPDLMTVCSTEFVPLVPRSCLGHFANYAFRAEPIRLELNSRVDSATKSHQRVSPRDIEKLDLAWPPIPEQSAIIHYLDYIDQRIRHYIRTKQKLIKLLEEQKKAIIHQAVTRGLDPNVRLKPSGVEWLGDVPEHWEVTKLHRITDPRRPVMYGIVLPGPSVDDGVFIVKGGNCEPGRLRAECLSRTTFDIEGKYARSRLNKDDIVYAIRGSIGAAELVPIELVGANLTQDAARIAPCAGILPKWLLYFVQSKAFFSKLDAGAVGATIRGINIRDLKRADVIVPPTSEQFVIAEHLEAENERFAFVIGRAHREISLLREYRTRLIADVVTGKLDVREAAANLPEETEVMETFDDSLAEDGLENGEIEDEQAGKIEDEVLV
ncbi:Type I restriction-modification system, specificity subunit S [Methanosarcina lacustris Z-7289]|uniref:Type I restriction-modification system, specificity subunit S n=1 Tax=Methanosarcina lacustris Z-7289 TaxID=1434111 RepID=A0A0E3S5X7_9EURY|nr:restriction endonuclease subunit S [Methanosarcina lacustris]AKB74647.1 Type I restriction-modification system, specificity subunit S [Methanosarcina lacustris Z-7289]